jgi:hypothetical protein
MVWMVLFLFFIVKLKKTEIKKKTKKLVMGIEKWQINENCSHENPRNS